MNISVESITLHPEFNPDAHTHDLALIRLSRPTKFEKRISPICLPNPGMISYITVRSEYKRKKEDCKTQGDYAFKYIFCTPGSTYLGQVGTLVGWTVRKLDDNADVRTCKPRKLGLPILGYNECIKSGINPMNFNDDYGCIGVVGTNSLVCEVSELYVYRITILNHVDQATRNVV